MHGKHESSRVRRRSCGLWRKKVCIASFRRLRVEPKSISVLSSSMCVSWGPHKSTFWISQRDPLQNLSIKLFGGLIIKSYHNPKPKQPKLVCRSPQVNFPSAFHPQSLVFLNGTPHHDWDLSDLPSMYFLYLFI